MPALCLLQRKIRCACTQRIPLHSQPRRRAPESRPPQLLGSFDGGLGSLCSLVGFCLGSFHSLICLGLGGIYSVLYVSLCLLGCLLHLASSAFSSSAGLCGSLVCSFSSLLSNGSGRCFGSRCRCFHSGSSRRYRGLFLLAARNQSSRSNDGSQDERVFHIQTSKVKGREMEAHTREAAFLSPAATFFMYGFTAGFSSSTGQL